MMAYPRTHALFNSSFGNVVMRQYWADLALWELFLNKYGEIHTVIELGAFQGGMTAFLAVQAAMRSQRFVTFDKDVPDVLMTDLAVRLDLHSAFVHGDFWQETNSVLVHYLTADEYKPIMLFVDGGNKPKELRMLTPYLRAGDYVAVHDYGTEFQPNAEDPVAHLLERVFWEECEAPPQPCLTRFWRRL